jgi:hypothetical protein
VNRRGAKKSDAEQVNAWRWLSADTATVGTLARTAVGALVRIQRIERRFRQDGAWVVPVFRPGTGSTTAEGYGALWYPLNCLRPDGGTKPPIPVRESS